MFQQYEEDDLLECARHNLINKYRMMKCPFQKQKLQLLYPGKFLSQDDEPEGYNIPHSDPDALEKTRKMSSSLRAAYDMEKEALSRHLGGEYKVFPFPAVEPEAIIDDPGLRGLDIEVLNKVPTTKYEGSNANPLNNLGLMVEDRNKIMDEARKNDEITSYETILDDNQKLPEYDWSDTVQKEYPRVNIGEPIPQKYYDKRDERIADSIREPYKYIDLGDYSNTTKKWKYMGIFMCIIMVVLLLIVVALAVIY